MNKYTNYEIFVLVVEQGGVTQAAEYVNLTKAAISKIIKNLEKSANVDFFDRTHRSLKLTSAGEHLYSHCKRIQKELIDTRDFLNQFHENPSGIVRVAVPSYFAAHYLYPHLIEFQEQVPELTIVIDSREELFDLNNENIDLVYGFSVLPDDDKITQRKLGHTRYVISASPKYLKKHGTPQSIDELSKHIYIEHHLRSTTSVTEQLKDKFKFCIEVTNSRELVDAGLSHLGIIKTPHYTVADYLKESKLVEILPNETVNTIPIYLYYKYHRYIKPKVRNFIDFFQEKNKNIKF